MTPPSPDTLRSAVARLWPEVVICNTAGYWRFKLNGGIYDCHDNDPLLDLNAAATVEATLTPTQLDDYGLLLSKSEIATDEPDTPKPWTLFDEYGWQGLLRASALQRFTALVAMKEWK